MHTNNPPQTEANQPDIVSVRSLVEFVLQAGDLTTGGFQRRDRAQLAMEVRGRIDGLYASAVPVIIEEIKTTTLSLQLVSEQHNHLHWAQAQCYVYMYAQQHRLREVNIHVTYYHLDTEEEKTFERRFTFAELETFFSNLITRYLDWFRKVQAWHFQNCSRSVKAER